MRDALCFACGSGWCVHGEGSLTTEELEMLKLQAQVRQLTGVAAAALKERDEARAELEALKRSKH